MTSKPTQPTARKRYQSMLNGGFRLEDDRVDFLIKLVEAAVTEGSACYDVGEIGHMPQEHFTELMWDGIDQRLAEGKK